MKEWNTTYLIDALEDITFRAAHFCINEGREGLICSLEGEFLKGGQSFDPPMEYRINNVGVTSRNLTDILSPIYSYLRSEREKAKPL